jgi:hypothetical protein
MNIRAGGKDMRFILYEESTAEVEAVRAAIRKPVK